MKGKFLTTFLILLTLTSTSLAGCVTNQNESTDSVKSTVRIAYYLAEDSSEDASANGFAQRLASDLGVQVELFDVSSEGMIIQALRFGNADIGFLEENDLLGLPGKSMTCRCWQ